MPTYEYRCNACKREFEYEQRISDDDLVKCEACGEDKLEKLISRTAFQLKGSGWYKDLYASPPAAKADAAKTETKDAAAGASSATSDSSSASSSSSDSSSSSSPSAAATSATPSPASSPTTSSKPSGGSKD